MRDRDSFAREHASVDHIFFVLPTAADPTSVQGALRKWINPVIGDLPLGMVDNLILKPLVK